jgi:hypothetical protein
LFAIVNGTLQPPAASLDGTRVPRDGRVSLSAGKHDLTIDAPANFSGVLLARGSLRNVPAVAQPQTENDTATKWTVVNPARGTLELTELNDGNWVAQAGSKTIEGVDCDLFNTCFDVPSGRAVIYHRLPEAIWLGFAVSGLVIVFAILSVLPLRNRS